MIKIEVFLFTAVSNNNICTSGDDSLNRNGAAIKLSGAKQKVQILSNYVVKSVSKKTMANKIANQRQIGQKVQKNTGGAFDGEFLLSFFKSTFIILNFV